MVPAIFCTVASGAGLGLLVLLVLVEIAAYGGGLSKRMLASGFAMAAVLISGGLGASVLSLVNPTSLTRAPLDWKRSWVSREALLVIALYPVAAIYVWSTFVLDAESGPSALQIVAAGLVVIIALATLVATGMIYGCSKDIAQWASPLVPAGYLSIGLYCGSLLLVALAAAQGSPLAPFTVVAFAFLTICAVVKGLYYHRFKVAQAQWRYVFLALAFVVPIVAIGLELGSSWLPAVAAVVAIAGVLVERWLFFAEARGGVDAPPGEPVA